MSHPSKPLSDAQANQVLARAVELDAKLRAATGVEELRKAAIEAGISPEAFDAAVREAQVAQPRRRPRLATILSRHLLAAAAFWVALSGVTRAVRWLTPSDSAHTLALLLATAVGIQIAHRLRATLLRTLLVAVGAGQAVVFLFRLAGIETAQPHLLNWAVTFTGLLAAGVVTFLRRSPPNPGEHPVPEATTPSPGQDPQAESLLRLAIPAPQP